MVCIDSCVEDTDPDSASGQPFVARRVNASFLCGPCYYRRLFVDMTTQCAVELVNSYACYSPRM